jgi:hypothetical protein
MLFHNFRHAANSIGISDGASAEFHHYHNGGSVTKKKKECNDGGKSVALFQTQPELRLPNMVRRM